MVNYTTSLKTWGATGEEFPDNYNYVEGEQPVDAWDNYFNSNVINDIEHLIDVTNNELLARDGSVALTAPLDFSQNAAQNIAIESNTVSSDHTTAGEQLLFVDTSGGPITITLASADVYDGNSVTVTDVGGSASSNFVTIETEGSESIDGGTSTTIEQNYSTVKISSNGSNWFTSGGGGGGTLSQTIIDTDKDWQNFDIYNVRKLSAEDGNVCGKTLESGDAMTIKTDESMVVSESYTVDGDLTIEDGGSLTVM